MLIVFEGIDGCGKSTLSRAFADAKDFTWTREPTFSSEEADRLNLKEMESAAREVEFLIDRVKHQSFLNKHPKVVCDRYIWSGLAYCKVFNPSMFDLVTPVYSHRYFKKPDCYVFVDTPIDICIERGRAQTKEQLGQIREAYFETIPEGVPLIVTQSVGGLENALQDLLDKLGKHWPELSQNITQTNLFLEI